MRDSSRRSIPGGVVRGRDSKQPRPELRLPYEPPGSEIERKLIVIWEDVLSIRGIGVLDDFFELGGHSIGALQIADEVAECFDIDFPVARVFEAENIASQARIVARAIGSPEEELDEGAV